MIIRAVCSIIYIAWPDRSEKLIREKEYKEQNG